MGRDARILALVTATVLAAGCPSTAPANGRAELIVFAASSLTEPMADLEATFERAHPDVDVVRSHAGSQVLRLQIEQGARADVFASADERQMSALASAGLVEAAEVFATDTLVLVVPHDDSVEMTSLHDLPRARRVVVAGPDVPLGVYTRAVLERAERVLGPEPVAAIRTRIVSEESNARLVRAKVELGEADAAFVYRSDAEASTRVRAVGLPPEVDVRAHYPIAVVASSPRAALAREFVALARSAEGARIVRARGMIPPEGEAP